MKVILNSDNRVNSTHESAVWTLSEAFHSNTQFRVRSAIIPNTSPSFRVGENTLVIGGVNVSVPAQKRYSTMAAFLLDLNAAVVGASIPNVSSLVFSFDTEEGCLVFTYTSSASWAIVANERFGVQSQIMPAATNVTLPFGGIFSLVPYKAILLSSNSLMTHDVRSSNDIGSAVALIPMTGNFGDLVVYQNENGEYMKLTAGATVDRVHLMLRDEKGRTVDLQDQSWLIELEII